MGSTMEVCGGGGGDAVDNRELTDVLRVVCCFEEQHSLWHRIEGVTWGRFRDSWESANPIWSTLGIPMIPQAVPGAIHD